MWKFRSIVILATLVMALIVGASVAHGYWWWNSGNNVEGVHVRTVWAVVDGTGHYYDSEAYDYRTTIRIALPAEAEASTVTEASTENAVLVPSERLACTPEGIQAVVKYLVAAKGEVTGKYVVATVVADGKPIGSAVGHVNEVITLPVLIPKVNPDCYVAPADSTYTEVASVADAEGLGKKATVFKVKRNDSQLPELCLARESDV